MSKRYSGKSFKDSSVMKKPKLTFKEKRKIKEEKKRKDEKVSSDLGSGFVYLLFVRPTFDFRSLDKRVFKPFS